VTHSVPEFLPAPAGCLEIPRELPLDATFVRYIQPAFFAVTRPPLFSYRPRHSCSLFVAYQSRFLRITPRSRAALYTLAAEGIVGWNDERRPAN